MAIAIQIVSIIGLLLSIYAIYIEKQVAKQKGYKAVCDISDKMNCGKVLTSKYGTTAGVSNSVAGVIFYIIIFLLSFYNITYVLYLAILSIIGSVYLAYFQYFKLKTLCLVCSSIYVVNILLVIFSYLRL